MPEIAEPPAQTEPVVENFDAAVASFDTAMGQAEPAKPDAAKAEAEKAPAESKPVPEKEIGKADSEFPAELMTGDKSVVKEVVEADDILKAEPPANLSKKGAADWQKMRDRAAKVDAENAAVRKEMEALKAAPAKPDESTAAELKAERARNAELDAMLERVAFEKSPKFKKFLADEKANIDGAKAFLEGTEIDGSVIDRAASLTGSKRLAVLRDAGMDAETIAAVTPYLAQLDGINRDKAGALENFKETAKQWEAQEAARAEQLKAHERANDEAVFKRVGEEVARRFEPFQKVEGNDKWNAQVDALEAEAREFMFGSLPVERLAEIAKYGVGAKVVHAMFHAQRAELKAAKEQIAKLTAAQPTGGGETHKSTVADADLEPVERASREFERLMGR